jgi:hypothetical protein
MTTLNRFLLMALIPMILGCTSLIADISTISNDFIKIIVNDGPSDLGRFSIETSGGDLQRSSDDFQPLIYGRPIPWTSYTTILIDDQPYIFGGESPKHQKRVPTPLEFGKIVSHNVSSEKIETVCRFSPGVLVKQTVQFARNISTRVQDTALISYAVKNEDTTPHSVGVRILLDTKLGSNDGAPFRIGSDAVDSEISYSKSKLFDYWQTFDSLTSPNVIAQGTLTDHRYGVTPPDRISLVNWGTLFSSPWSFNYQQGRSFIREGEVENDTSLALYFNPTLIAPNDVKTVQTLYGLGGVQLAGGELALGVSGPSELFSTSKTPFLMMVYLRNSSQFISKDTKITIKLPSGFSTESGKTEFVLGDVDSMQTRQLPIRITPSSPTVGRNRISIEVTSSTLESNRIQHSIDVEGPARLKAKLQVPSQWKSDSSPYVKATLLVSNPTGHKISDISLKLIPGPGVSVADFDIDQKELAVLPPKKSQSVNWMVKLDPKYSKFPLSVSLDSPDISKDTISAQIIAASSLEDSLKVSSKKEGSFLSVDIVALPDLFKKESSAIVTTFANDELKFLRVRPTGGYNWSSEAQVKTIPGAVHFSPDLAKITRPVHIALYFKLTTENLSVPIVVRAGNVVKEISP